MLMWRRAFQTAEQHLKPEPMPSCSTCNAKCGCWVLQEIAQLPAYTLSADEGLTGAFYALSDALCMHICRCIYHYMELRCTLSPFLMPTRVSV